MSKKTFNLITGLVGAVSAAAITLVTFFDPVKAPVINGSISIATTAIIEICSKFVKE